MRFRPARCSTDVAIVQADQRLSSEVRRSDLDGEPIGFGSQGGETSIPFGVKTISMCCDH